MLIRPPGLILQACLVVLGEGNVGLAVVQLPLLWGVEGAVSFRNQVGKENKLQ